MVPTRIVFHLREYFFAFSKNVPLNEHGEKGGGRETRKKTTVEHENENTLYIILRRSIVHYTSVRYLYINRVACSIVYRRYYNDQRPKKKKKIARNFKKLGK